jgi:hypothetical protein
LEQQQAQLLQEQKPLKLQRVQRRQSLLQQQRPRQRMRVPQIHTA